MESRSFARRRCPMCSSSNPLNAPACDMCGYTFDQSEVQIVVPSGGTVSRQEARAAAATPAPSAVAPSPSAPPQAAARPAAQQTVSQRPQAGAQPQAPKLQAVRQESRQSSASVPMSTTNKMKPSGSNGSSVVSMQRPGTKAAAKPADKAANLARLLSSTNTTTSTASVTARMSPQAQASQLGIWMLISLLVLVGAVLATAAIFMNSSVRP